MNGKLIHPSAHLFLPAENRRVTDMGEAHTALARTTDLCIGAHQDDIEIMAYGPIAACYSDATRHFTGVTVTDGGGSPRTGIYAHYTDDQMKAIRIEEQNQAAWIGRYAAQVNLAYPSGEVKDPHNRALIEELKTIIQAAAPQVVYTHNLFDKHDTHVAVALRVITAIRELPAPARPRLIGMEVWRALDWLADADKVVHDTAPHPNLSAALLGVYDSQITGGKRYDLASQGRRLANATFFASHDVDDVESASFGVDMSALVAGECGSCKAAADAAAFVEGHIAAFQADVLARMARF
ncbi:MAG: PIG-L family deacetylase [Defluviitaleaceae bacterium]|nr:PIG-L family deacetylase [Defluviitaleaceae bacterium]